MSLIRERRIRRLQYLLEHGTGGCIRAWQACDQSYVRKYLPPLRLNDNQRVVTDRSFVYHPRRRRTPEEKREQRRLRLNLYYENSMRIRFRIDDPSRLTVLRISFSDFQTWLKWTLQHYPERFLLIWPELYKGIPQDLKKLIASFL